MPIDYLRTFTTPRRTNASNRRLGRSLAFVAGAANAGGFLAVGQYTSHMSGIVSALADNAAKPGVHKTADGLQYRVIKAGAGKTPQSPDDMVSVTYKGWMINGKVFDQTHGAPATFPAGALIPGWVEALSMMKEGDEWELVIPSDLGYGEEGAGNGAIPGGQTLVFDMTLITVTPAK